MLTPPARITFSEMKAWCDLTGHTLTPSEVQLLRAIDAVRYKTVNEDV